MVLLLLHWPFWSPRFLKESGRCLQDFAVNLRRLKFDRKRERARAMDRNIGTESLSLCMRPNKIIWLNTGHGFFWQKIIWLVRTGRTHIVISYFITQTSLPRFQLFNIIPTPLSIAQPSSNFAITAIPITFFFFGGWGSQMWVSAGAEAPGHTDDFNHGSKFTHFTAFLSFFIAHKSRTLLAPPCSRDQPDSCRNRSPRMPRQLSGRFACLVLGWRALITLPLLLWYSWRFCFY